MRYKKLKKNAKTPVYASASAAGADLYLCSDEPVSIGAGETYLAATGISVEIPDGYCGLLYARSGLATKRGLAPANKVGVIDSDYRGELMVSLYNHSGTAQVLQPYERIAQLVITPYIQVSYEEACELEDTARGAGGFGSTGEI